MVAALSTGAKLQPSDGIEMSDIQLRAMIEREAKALGLTLDDAISRVKKGDIGENYLWLDLASLVNLLPE